MSGLTKWVNSSVDIQKRVARLESTTQLGNSTVSGESALPVQSVVEEAAVTNDAMPIVQDDSADSNDGVTDLQDALSAADDDLDAQLADARAQLEDARVELELSQQDLEDAFGQRVDGLSEDVDTAIRAAGDAKTEAEAASDAALAASGLAASKGKTIVQVSAPTGANADPANLWINISTDSNGVPKNQPNRYNPDTAKWEPITDAQAVAAAQNAANAVAAAQAAKDVADQANAAAGVAKTAADNANTAALQAAGIANSKGKVITQASKPTGANAAAGNLWIRTSDNTPWIYDASIPDWVQVTDQNATNAAAAAVQAQQAATAAANAASAAQATADGKPLILFSSTAGPSGTAPTGSIWFLWDSAKNVAGQWLQSGTLANPVWTPQQIRSDVIANLDVAKLTAGSAAIADLVAQKIAAATANFQTVNVSNLFVTSGATMSQAVVDYLFANVVQAKKITAGMIDVSTLNGVSITGLSIIGGYFQTTAGGTYGSQVTLQSGSVRISHTQTAAYTTIRGDATGSLSIAAYDQTGTYGAGITLFSTQTNGFDIQLAGYVSAQLMNAPIVVADTVRARSNNRMTLDATTIVANGTMLKNNQDVTGTDWIGLPRSSGYVPGANSAPQIRLAGGGKTVKMRGQITKSSGNFTGSENSIATLPASYRPSVVTYAMTPTTGGNYARIRINTDGTIDVAGVTAGTTNYVLFDCITYDTD